MEYSKVTYDEVQKFEEVKGYEGDIYYNDGKYYFVTEKGTVLVEMVVYDLPKELYDLLVSGEKTLRDISWYFSEGRWPLTEEELRVDRREFIFKYPKMLVGDPDYQKDFSKEELKELIPIAEEAWIKEYSALPEKYVSPLKKKEIVIHIVDRIEDEE